MLVQGPVYGEREDFPAGSRELFETLNARSLMLLPMLVQGELRGTLAFACAGVHYWTAAERSALSAAGQTIAGVVENERLQDQLKRDERQYRELVGLSGYWGGSPEVEALGEVHAVVAQEFECLGVLDAFGDGELSEALGEVDDPLDEVLVGFA